MPTGKAGNGRSGRRSPPRRVVACESCGILIDVQQFFLAQLDKRVRSSIKTNTANLLRLLSYFRIPMVVTLERSIEDKGALPRDLSKHLEAGARILEKDCFDLTKERQIQEHLARLNKRQAILAGCETDVCVLESCLGLLDLGYDVFLVEDLLFSASQNVAAALARMQAEGAVLLSYKSLYYGLLETVQGGPRGEEIRKSFGVFPDDLPDHAAM
jgi:nicotinamidase-related amidase